MHRSIYAAGTSVARHKVVGITRCETYHRQIRGRTQDVFWAQALCRNGPEALSRPGMRESVMLYAAQE